MSITPIHENMASPPSTQNSDEFPQYTEKHKIVIIEGEMVSLDGQLLKEKKQLTTITSDDPAAPEERIYKEVSHFCQAIDFFYRYSFFLN